MAFKTTITFPVQNISPTETIQLILEFNTDLTGPNREWNAAEGTTECEAIYLGEL